MFNILVIVRPIIIVVVTIFILVQCKKLKIRYKLNCALLQLDHVPNCYSSAACVKLV